MFIDISLNVLLNQIKSSSAQAAATQRQILFELRDERERFKELEAASQLPYASASWGLNSPLVSSIGLLDIGSISNGLFLKYVRGCSYYGSSSLSSVADTYSY